jgi:hypothetical protein
VEIVPEEEDAGMVQVEAAPAEAEVITEEQKGQFVNLAIDALEKELDTLPVQSRFTAIALQAPPDIAAKLVKVDKLTDLLTVLAPYITPDRIGALGTKLFDEKAQRWVFRQVLIVKSAFIRAQKQEVPNA